MLFQPGVAAHQILHALGFWHTHTRYDRDDYVTVEWDNIMTEYRARFDIVDASLHNPFGLPYDYASLMHYSGKVSKMHCYSNAVKLKLAVFQWRSQVLMLEGAST